MGILTDETLEVPPLQPVAKDTVYERVYLGLRDALIVGRFPPGRPLTLRALSEAMGTSAMPVREALRRLAAERAVLILRNRSAIVPPLTRERLEDLRSVRVILEGEAAARAAGNIDEVEEKALASIMEEMRRAVAQRATMRYLSLNRDFHFTLYRASRSETLLPIIESLWLQAGPSLTLILEDVELSEQLALAHHEDALAAIAERDADATRRAIVGDINDAADFILGLLR